MTTQQNAADCMAIVEHRETAVPNATENQGLEAYLCSAVDSFDSFVDASDSDFVEVYFQTVVDSKHSV